MILLERVGRWFERHGWAVSQLLFVCVLLALAEHALLAGAAADPWSMAASQLCTLFTGSWGGGWPWSR